MSATTLDSLPGFRRRIVVRPSPGCVRSDVEDDYHRMGVTLHHDGGVVTAIEADMQRVPWTTCPGAQAMLSKSFTGAPLDGFGAFGDKFSNCTHLYDMAVLAAAHARDEAPLVYDILVSEPVYGPNAAELRLNGETVLGWTMERGRITTPAHLEGLRLDRLRPWIETLDDTGQEHARLLRWGSMLAQGRGRAYERKLTDNDLPLGACFTFQPDTAATSQYIGGTVRDFGGGGESPLADLA